MNYWTQSTDSVFVAAHRGWSEVYPENTMAAFRAALALGVDQIETDVRITADGELVLIHDATVDRTTDGQGSVSEMTFAELQLLDAGVKKDERFGGERIPTLRALFELVKDHPTITLDLELKEYPTQGRERIAYEVCDRVLAMVCEYGFEDRIVINSFSGMLHDYIQKRYGNRFRHHVFFPWELLGECELDPREYAYCACLFGSNFGMSAAPYFELVRSHGVRTWVGASVRDEKSLDAAIECGAELITCNNPDEILRLLRQKGKHQ